MSAHSLWNQLWKPRNSASLQATYLPAATAFDQMHFALQCMDSFDVIFVWILVSLLPRSTNLPWSVRWLGWIMAATLLAPDPAFLLVVLLSPFWPFVLGHWMLRQPYRS